MSNQVLEAIARYEPELTGIRQDLHMYPELGFEEVRTSGVVSAQLTKLGIEPRGGYGKTGVVGVITGTKGHSEYMVGLRADMDALPLCEETDLPFKSRIAGKMHGCGHDGHTTILLGAAQYLAENRHTFSGSVACIFQPGEEGHAGARAMIEDGLFRDFPVSSVYALHNWPSMPLGTIGINAGPMMAAIDKFDIRIRGLGGHGGHPEKAVDASLVAAQVITGIQLITSRNINPLDSGTIGVHYLNSGGVGRLSVVPEEAEIQGMAKWYDEKVQAIIRSRLADVCTKSAEMFGASATLDYDPLYPPTINHPDQAKRVISVGRSILSIDNVADNLQPSMGSEDFAFMLREKPGAYFRLGQGGEANQFLHSPSYQFNDAVIPIGSAMLAQIALSELQDNAATL